MTSRGFHVNKRYPPLTLLHPMLPRRSMTRIREETHLNLKTIKYKIFCCIDADTFEWWIMRSLMLWSRLPRLALLSFVPRCKWTRRSHPSHWTACWQQFRNLCSSCHASRWLTRSEVAQSCRTGSCRRIRKSSSHQTVAQLHWTRHTTFCSIRTREHCLREVAAQSAPAAVASAVAVLFDRVDRGAVGICNPT